MPPYNAVIAVADQVPEVIIPAVCIEENITPVPSVLSERTVVPFILKVLPEAKFQLSDDDQPTPEYQFIDLSDAPRNVIPPPWAVKSLGEATTPSSIFLSATVIVVELIVVNVPWTLRSP